MHNKFQYLLPFVIIIGFLCMIGCGNKTGSVEPDQSASSPEEIIGTEVPDRSTETTETTETTERSELTESSETIEPTEPAELDMTLKVEGSVLVDSNGHAVQLRGMSTHGLAWFPQYVNREFFRELHDEWEANAVRLAMYTEEYGGYCGGGDREELKNLVKSGVEYATDAGLYVIIDWHILADGNPNQHLEDAKAFFEEMSDLYANHTNVLYEICNEPNGATDWASIKRYALEIIPVIREKDPDAVIIVGTPTWSQDIDKAAADPITEYDNIMYTLHFYAASHTEWLRERLKNAVKSGLPVFVSEFGICDASGNGQIDYDQAKQWVQTMDELGISYLNWNLSNKNETSACFKESVSKSNGFTVEDLSDSGNWIYTILREHASNTPDNE